MNSIPEATCGFCGLQLEGRTPRTRHKYTWCPVCGQPVPVARWHERTWCRSVDNVNQVRGAYARAPGVRHQLDRVTVNALQYKLPDS